MNDFTELKLVKELANIKHPLFHSEELTRIQVGHNSYPILGFEIGCQDPVAPTLGLFAGVHGLEKIGTHVVVNFLSTLMKELEWDRDLHALLETSRIVSIPLINPGGMSTNNRSNPNGIDLMRNAPVEMDEHLSTTPFVSGHRISNKLPWYRGVNGAEMEKELQALVKFVQKNIFSATTSMSIDFHSGFGMKDRFWFPYSKTSAPFPRTREVQNIRDRIDETFPQHVYIIEPQSASYTIRGDVWDYLFDLHRHSVQFKENVYIPWTLEMGSWIWLKKNPRQIFSMLGYFNPMVTHRYDRTMRRHLRLIELMFKLVRNKEAWI